MSAQKKGRTKIGVLHGPNLNLLGSREKRIYGGFSLHELETYLKEEAPPHVMIDFFQSNHEGEIIEYIHGSKKSGIKSLVINAAGYTHTSVSIRDSLLSVQVPFIEVHLSNIYQREHFRHKSVLADIAEGVITGLGRESYRLAIEYFARL